MSDGATGRGPVEAIACPACGQANPAGFRLCGMCGEPLAPRASERRKLATLLFCDMSGSTAMGERVDAESVRVAMSRYFHTMRDAIDRHGGTVEKFIGDAVVAIFGVPVAHEDDALRAVRAAWEMQARLVDLNAELLERVGTTIALRIGVNTGEVVSGDASARESVVTGDAVNTAARLEQAAKPGEILLGELTWTLVRDLVDAEFVSPIQAKGKAEPVPAYRLLGFSAGDVPRAGRSETALVGRAVELTALQSAWDAARAGRRGQVVTVVGEPGVGKSRLAREFAQSLGTARILSGRCLSYGDGITWWPVSQIVREAAAIRDDHTPAEARSQIENTLPDDARAGLVAAVLAQALGLGDGAGTVDEIGWAVRRLLSGLAGERPTLVVLDDVQWAEAVIHELIDSLTTMDEPLLCLCLARPELLELRTDLEAIRLEPLGARDASEHARLLVERAGLAAADAARVLAAAGGNPLFAEELVAMITENPDATMPPSLAALISARLDLLPDTEREHAGLRCRRGRGLPRGRGRRPRGAAGRRGADVPRRQGLRPPDALELLG